MLKVGRKRWVCGIWNAWVMLGGLWWVKSFVLRVEEMASLWLVK
jgi:hypothetical protein